MDEFLEYLLKKKKEIKQSDLSLRNTKLIAQLVRDSRVNNFPDSICEELFKLMESVARLEWGHNTQVDDFSVPTKFVIKCEMKEEII